MRLRPPSIRRFYTAFEYHANELVAKNPSDRNKDTQNRIDAQIYQAWENDLKQAVETKQTTFLRDYFNSFQEIVDACDHLDTLFNLVCATTDDLELEEGPRTLIFWTETYLNEVYIYRERLKIFLRQTERHYKKDPDFKEPIQILCPELEAKADEELDSFVKIRGEHVHKTRSRYFDPEIIRLRSLDVAVKGFERSDLQDELEDAMAESKDWLLTQLEHCREVCWQLTDSICNVLAEGIVTENDRLIVPTNHKD